MSNLLVTSLVAGEALPVLVGVLAVVLGDWGHSQPSAAAVQLRERQRRRH